MATEVQSLLDAVRKRLWRRRLAAATRIALWSTAALLLLAAALHLATRGLPPAALLAAALAPWLPAFAWAAARRPTNADCALWADRRLGGMSVYGTLLELQSTAPGGNTPALRHLRAWAASQAPQARRALAELDEPSALLRPTMALLVCAALAGLVHALWQAGPPARTQLAAGAPPAAGEPASAAAPAPGAAPTLPETAPQAVAAVEPRQRHADTSAPQGPLADAATAFDPLAVARAATAAGPAPAAAAAAGDADRAAGQTAGSRSGSGREAGDAADERPTPAPSRAFAGPLATQHSGFGDSARRPTRADSGEAATYDEAIERAGAALVLPDRAIRAAAPPAAADSQLTPSETHYVQAWMRANARAQ